MKKILVLTAVLALSACGCMNQEDAAEPTVVYQNVQARPQNCDYFDGTTCYRYVRRVHQQPVVRYREVQRSTSSCGCMASQYVAPVQDCSCGAPQVRETREPVEVVYKKTTYTTRYEPQTTAAVSYERVPYSQAETKIENVSTPVVRQQASAPVEVVVPAASNEELYLDIK